MGLICIALCYLCLLFLILFSVFKSKRRIFSRLLIISATLFLLCLVVWGILRNY